MPPGHRETVQRAFASQAAAFEDRTRAFGRADALAWIAAHVPHGPDDSLLEVAAGTALVARSLAPAVRRAVAVDLTWEMLDEGRRAADGQWVHVAQGDAVTLPFADAMFDLVVCRLAVHHYEDPTAPLVEMVRVCRPAGFVCVIDMVAPSADVADVLNRLERLRDPSHTRALTRDALHGAVASTGARIVGASAWDNVLDGRRWLEQTETPPGDTEVITAAWNDELAGGPPTGMQPRHGERGVELIHRWELVLAQVG